MASKALRPSENAQDLERGLDAFFQGEAKSREAVLEHLKNMKSKYCELLSKGMPARHSYARWAVLRNRLVKRIGAAAVDKLLARLARKGPKGLCKFFPGVNLVVGGWCFAEDVEVHGPELATYYATPVGGAHELADALYEWWNSDSEKLGEQGTNAILDIVKNLEQHEMSYPDHAPRLQESIDALWGVIEGR